MSNRRLTDDASPTPFTHTAAVMAHLQYIQRLRDKSHLNSILVALGFEGYVDVSADIAFLQKHSREVPNGTPHATWTLDNLAENLPSKFTL